MKHHFARQVVIVKLAVLTLGALCLLQAPVPAQRTAGYIVIFPSVGLAIGQSLRLTLVNPDGEPVRAQARARHSGGVNVLLADGSVRSGTFHTFDFKRSDIPLPGEDGTGRIQLSPSLSFFRPTSSEVRNPVVTSLEIVEIRDGTSNTILVGEAIPASPGGDGLDVLIGGSTQHTLMGVGPLQTLRVTVFNPHSAGRDQPPSRLMLFEKNGSLIAQSQDLVIPPGTFRSVDFKRSDIPLPGEDPTGRLQLRVHLDQGTRNPSPLPARTEPLVSFEVIDNTTGRTTARVQNNLKQIGLGSH